METKHRGRPKKQRQHIDNTTVEKLFYLLATREEQTRFIGMLAMEQGNRNATSYASRIVSRELPPMIAAYSGKSMEALKAYMQTPAKAWNIEDWR